MNENICVPTEHVGLEVDEFVCLVYPEVSKGFVRRMIRSGRVLVDGMPTPPSACLRRDQVVTLDFDPDEAAARVVAEELPELRVLYEDADLIAVDKPPGVAAEPERWARDRAVLSDVLLARAESESVGERLAAWRPRLVHRLDKDTSGVLLAAKDLEVERALRTAFEERRVRKGYLALVEGELLLEAGESELIDRPIGPRGRRDGRMRIDVRGGKPAVTRISVERSFRGFTLLRCEPLTGRTHQLRVHLQDRGFPLAVDPLYGRREALLLSEVKSGYRKKAGHVERPMLARLSLHAHDLELLHPRSGAPLRIEAPLPADIELALKQLGKHRAWTR